MTRISVVINTRNEEENITQCLESVRGFADEMVVVDMESEDKTVEIAKRFKVKVFNHKWISYVEPARNFALSRTTGDWILVLDPDEELPDGLAKTLKEIAKQDKLDYVELPRKNIIFGKWIEYSRWWPDYNIRFFRKGKVKWSDKIHAPPIVDGFGEKLPANQENAIIHHHYQSISQYIKRLNRYTDVQVESLKVNQYQFVWSDLVRKPVNEFLSRFFAGQGYKDGLHGLVLALLQAFSEFVLYLKVWEKEGFSQEDVILNDFKRESKKTLKDLKHWQANVFLEKASIFKKPFVKLKNKIF